MKLLVLVFTLLISFSTFSKCNFNVTKVTGCLGSNTQSITTSYLKYFLASKGYTYNEEKSDYSFTVIYTCTSNSHQYPQQGVYIIQKDNHSNFEETYFSASNEQRVYFQTLKAASFEVAICNN